MGLYIGNAKSKIILNDIVFNLNLFSEILIANGVKLLSYDGCVLKDCNGLYLTAKEDE